MATKTIEGILTYDDSMESGRAKLGKPCQTRKQACEFVLRSLHAASGFVQAAMDSILTTPEMKDRLMDIRDMIEDEIGRTEDIKENASEEEIACRM